MKPVSWGLLWFTLLMHVICEPPREPVCESLWRVFQETNSAAIRFDALSRYEDLDCDELPYPASHRGHVDISCDGDDDMGYLWTAWVMPEGPQFSIDTCIYVRHPTSPVIRTIYLKPELGQFMGQLWTYDIDCTARTVVSPRCPY